MYVPKKEESSCLFCSEFSDILDIKLRWYGLFKFIKKKKTFKQELEKKIPTRKGVGVCLM